MKENQVSDNEIIENDPDELATKWKLVRVGFNVFRQFDDTYYTGFAASIAYFFFMASMPTMLVLSQFLGIFDLSLDVIREWLISHSDVNTNEFVIELLSPNAIRWGNLLMLFIAIWASSSLEFSLTRLNTHVLSEGSFRFNYWRERFRALPMALLTLLTITFTLVIYLYGDEFLKQVFDRYHALRILLALRVPIAIGLFFAMILLSYYTLTRIRVPLKAVMPGAIIATIGIMILTLIYAIYIGFIADYNILYGSFANFVGLMLWFYLMSWVLCIGMMANKAWDEVFERGMLTPEKMKEYLANQVRNGDTDIEKMFVREEDRFDPETESIAVKMSRRFDPGYQDELEEERIALAEARAIEDEMASMYEDSLNE